MMNLTFKREYIWKDEYINFVVALTEVTTNCIKQK